MNLLFISKLFPPTNAIGAVRPYNIAKYLPNYGNRVISIVGINQNMDNCGDDIDDVIRVTNGRIGNWRASRTKSFQSALAVGNKTTKKRIKIYKYLRFTAAQIIYMLEQLEWSRNARKVACEILDNEKIDVIITDFGPEASALCGLYLKKKYPKIKWISDMRDPMDSYHLPKWRRLINSRWQKKMLKSADEVVTVSYALANQLSTDGKKVRVVENGYETQAEKKHAINDGILRIGYTGAMYNGMRDMSVLFRAISELSKDGDLPIQIHYAGANIDLLVEQAEKYDAEKYIVNHGFVAKKEALELQEMCDILCVLSWNTEHEKGVLTGKFPEYMRLKKPILSIVSGDVPDAELTQRVKDMKLGFAFEEANFDLDYPKLKLWVEEAIECKKNQKALPFEAKDEEIEQFYYPNLISRFNDILTEVANNS